MESFYSVLNTLILDAIPEKEVKISSQKSKPCWWNNSVKLAKKTLNHWQSRFKNRNTIQNKNALVEAEN